MEWSRWRRGEIYRCSRRKRRRRRGTRCVTTQREREMEIRDKGRGEGGSAVKRKGSVTKIKPAHLA